MWQNHYPHHWETHWCVRKQARICTTPWWARRLSARRRTNQVLNGTRHNSSNSIYSNIRSQLLDDTEIAQFGDPQKTLEDLGSICWGWDKQPWAYRALCLTRDHCVFVSPKSKAGQTGSLPSALGAKPFQQWSAGITSAILAELCCFANWPAHWQWWSPSFTSFHVPLSHAGVIALSMARVACSLLPIAAVLAVSCRTYLYQQQPPIKLLEFGGSH